MRAISPSNSQHRVRLPPQEDFRMDRTVVRPEPNFVTKNGSRPGALSPSCISWSTKLSCLQLLAHRRSGHHEYRRRNGDWWDTIPDGHPLVQQVWLFYHSQFSAYGDSLLHSRE